MSLKTFVFVFRRDKDAVNNVHLTSTEIKPLMSIKGLVRVTNPPFGHAGVILADTKSEAEDLVLREFLTVNEYEEKRSKRLSSEKGGSHVEV